jgi:hypothetical protein
MKRIFQLVTILSLFLLQQCGQSQQSSDKSKTVTPVAKRYVDTSIYSILPHDTSDNWMSDNATSATLSKDDLLEVERILKNSIKEYNKEQQRQFEAVSEAHSDYKLKKEDFIIDLKRYKRQYIPVINKKGDKEVWVNCFCSTSDSTWKQNVVFVKDGGNCYFNLVINLTNKSFYRFTVNGEA